MKLFILNMHELIIRVKKITKIFIAFPKNSFIALILEPSTLIFNKRLCTIEMYFFRENIILQF